MAVQILIGDVFEQLRQLPDNSFDCVVNSPPYWGLRDYGIQGQIGLEPTLGEHLDTMVRVYREVRRVLKAHGTLWINYGDCYATTPNGRAAVDVENDDRTFRDKPFSTIGPVYDPKHSKARGAFTSGDRQSHIESGGRIVAGGFMKPKDLCMVPNRLAIALQDDGWWVRSEIIWNKTNPKPESIADRPAAVHEKIWLLTKSETYYFNPEALKEPVTGGAHARRKDGQYKPAKGSTGGQNREGTWVETYVPEMRNGRNVWTFNIEGFREAHFATFPRELARRCIGAGAPPTVCACCGAVQGCGPICDVYGRAPARILDPFGGSGTTAIVAASFGHDCTLIELNPEYAEIARRRIGSLAPTVERAA
ncbi:site-specific DNA-methyltransferase [Mesorhizobium sp. M0644]|uniref:DNA-methyltransferase n=1 Tax=Mesorhizobium sp. M0644 TaxID=2956979 RepID=UPI00333D37A8